MEVGQVQYMEEVCGVYTCCTTFHWQGAQVLKQSHVQPHMPGAAQLHVTAGAAQLHVTAGAAQLHVAAAGENLVRGGAAGWGYRSVAHTAI
jgi:hypothetical protein